jgi:TRAP-type transport system periplasmic protein
VRRRGWQRRWALLVAMLAVAAGMLASSGIAVAKTTLTLGYVTTPQHPYGIALQHYADEVNKLSSGDLQIKLLPNYQGGDVPLLGDVRGGAVDMASVSSAIWDTVKINCFDALQAPLLITNYGLEGKIIGGSIGASMLKCTQKLGLVGLAIHEGGLRKPLGKSPLLAPSDWVGKKIRAPQSNVLSAGIRALGADPTPLAVTEVYNALRSGTVDGMEANLGLIYTNKYYEVAKYVTQNVNLWPFPTVLVINADKYKGLSASQRKVLRDAAAGLPAYSVNIFLKPAKGATNFVTALCDAGIKYAFASKSQVAALQSKFKSAYTQLQKDPQTKSYITQIQAVAKATPPPPAPPAPPAKCTYTAKK